MLKGKTKSGFEFSIDENQLDDWVTFKLIRGVDANPFLAIDLVSRILGDEQEELLMKHVEDENGHIKASSVSNELKEILETSAQLKNS